METIKYCQDEAPLSLEGHSNAFSTLDGKGPELVIDRDTLGVDIVDQGNPDGLLRLKAARNPGDYIMLNGKIEHVDALPGAWDDNEYDVYTGYDDPNYVEDGGWNKLPNLPKQNSQTGISGGNHIKITHG